MLVDQLQQVFVAGDDQRLQAHIPGEPGDRSQHVVGLVALDFDMGNIQRIEHLLNSPDL